LPIFPTIVFQALPDRRLQIGRDHHTIQTRIRRFDREFCGKQIGFLILQRRATA
jgi:hypothetical protein